MSYPGSKGQAGTYQRIIGNMRPHSVYVEAFVGSGQIFQRKLPAADNVIIDASGEALRILTPKVASLQPVSIIHGDALDILPQMELPKDTVIYCDPPYVLSTRAGRKYYDHEMTDAQHKTLLQILIRMECDVLISGYPSALYSDLLKDWRCISYQTRTRGRTLTECLWCNFPPPTELHDWRYAGFNHRERVTLKRQAERWTARLENMPPLKRGYLLNAVHQSQNRRCVPVHNAGNGVAR